MNDSSASVLYEPGLKRSSSSRTEPSA